jgi:diacylglycerol kinase family enzyme
MHRKTKKLTIRCDRPTPINLDGELRVADTVNMSIAEEKIRFFYPKGLVWQKKELAKV